MTGRRRSPSRTALGRAVAAFVRIETSGSIVLLAATAVAFAWANSPFSASYEDLWHHHLRLSPTAWGLDLDLRHWVNEALMAAFFLVVGLEIKREMTIGEFRERRAATVPIVAALGGMVVPAALYLVLAGSSGEQARGWGVPIATDIAFALGVLTALGRRVPSGAKVFLLLLAIADDVGAIVVIAAFYSDDVSLLWLAGAAASVFASWAGVRATGRAWPAVVAGAVAWYLTLRSGVHPTIAAVAIGLAMPAGEDGEVGPLVRLEERLHPFTTYLVIPLFALANAGIEIGGGGGDGSNVFLGVLVGLVVGKPVGVSLFALAAVVLRLGRLPDGLGLRHLVGVAALAGIGFTVALFVAELAFGGSGLLVQAKRGVLVASLASAVLGVVVLFPGKHDNASDR